MYWNKNKECMPREQLENLQLQRLKKMVKKIYHEVDFYKEKFQEMEIDPNDIQSLEDLKKLPFTNKTDLRENYPYKMFAEPLSKIVRIHATSGTTGKPTVVGYTRKDLDMWEEIIARALTISGADQHSFIQNAYGYGLFTGGLGIHGGAERIGASIIPISSGNTQKQLMLMRDFGSTHLSCTPSYALLLAEAIQEAGIKKEELSLKAGIFGAEPWTENMRKEIESKLGIKAYDIFGMAELCGPGVGIECEEQNGIHIWEDYFIPEIINPETGENLEDGEVGELVVTTLTKEGIPLLRYRTHDITRILPGECKCGRTHKRIERLQGRVDDMMVIRGVNVFPTQIESVILEFKEVEPHYQLVVRRDGPLDTLEVKVELSTEYQIDSIPKLENLAAQIKGRIKSLVGIAAKVTLVEPKNLPRSEGKAKRVVDLRNL